MRILLVDDEEPLRGLLKRAIEQTIPKVKEIIEARDGIDALIKLKRYPVDLIITDLEMPGLNGLELAKSLRLKAEYAQLPIIVLSGAGVSDAMMIELQQANTVFLAKPKRLDRLIEFFKSYLQT